MYNTLSSFKSFHGHTSTEQNIVTFMVAYVHMYVYLLY